MKTLNPTAPRTAELFPGGNANHDLAAAGVIRLGPRDVRAFDGISTREVYCAGGAVWVTQDGVGADLILNHGEWYEPRPRGKVVVQPLTPAASIVVTFKT